jgi:hypothetical protein
VYYPPTDPQALRAHLESMGCETELDAAHTLIAVNLPPRAALAEIQAFLMAGEAAGQLGYEEAILMG